MFSFVLEYIFIISYITLLYVVIHYYAICKFGQYVCLAIHYHSISILPIAVQLRRSNMFMC